MSFKGNYLLGNTMNITIIVPVYCFYYILSLGKVTIFFSLFLTLRKYSYLCIANDIGADMDLTAG